MYNYGASRRDADSKQRLLLRRQALRRRRIQKLRKLFTLLLVVVLIVAGVTAGIKFLKGHSVSEKVKLLGEAEVPGWIDVQILPLLCDSRRGEKLEDITGIVIHYVGNPGTTAQQNRDYYGNSGTDVNSHFVVGLDGKVIQCIPLDEKSSASNDRNRDTISIEVCHPDETGKFTEESYESVVKLAAWLCDLCGLDTDDVIRHYDITGKLCPLYYVEHEDAWLQLKTDIENARSR